MLTFLYWYLFIAVLLWVIIYFKLEGIRKEQSLCPEGLDSIQRLFFSLLPLLPLIALFVFISCITEDKDGEK
jgi:hypothetical protein